MKLGQWWEGRCGAAAAAPVGAGGWRGMGRGRVWGGSVQEGQPGRGRPSSVVDRSQGSRVCTCAHFPPRLKSVLGAPCLFDPPISAAWLHAVSASGKRRKEVIVQGPLHRRRAARRPVLTPLCQTAEQFRLSRPCGHLSPTGALPITSRGSQPRAAGEAAGVLWSLIPLPSLGGLDGLG